MNYNPNYNPYPPQPASPQPQYGAPDGGGPGGGGPLPWEIGEIIESGWALLKRAWAPLTVAGLCYFGIYLGVSMIFGVPVAILRATGIVDQDSIVIYGIQALNQTTSLVVSGYLQVGLLRIVLGLVRGESLPLRTLFSAGPRMFAAIGGQLLVGLAVVIGCVFLLVPGVILALGLSQTPYFIADSDMGPIEAMKASWSSTSGSKGKIFLFHLACFAMAVGGLMAFCIGIFPVMMLVVLAQGIMFVKLSGRGGLGGLVEPPTYGGGPMQGYGGYPPQGGGYGPPR